jgi:hypothetical protein
VAKYLSKALAGIRRVEPSSSEVASLLREIEAADPPPVERVWEGEGRRRKARLAGVHELANGCFLHVPWLRQPRPAAVGQTFWLVLAVVAAGTAGGLALLAGSVVRAVFIGGLVFSGLVGVGFRLRINDSRREAQADGGGGLPGFICLPDRLLIRYPDSLYELPRATLKAIVRRDRPHAQGEMAMAEYEMRAELDVGGRPVEVVIGEVVEVVGHEASADISERMAILLVLVDYLEQTYLRSAPGRRAG